VRHFLFLLLFTGSLMGKAAAQQVDSIFFNLYTDSLKKGSLHFNYINVDGKLSNGNYRPLDTTQIILHCSAGTLKGNVLQLADDDTASCVTITATLIQNPLIKKQVIIYVKQHMVTPVLPAEEELKERWQQKRRKNKALIARACSLHFLGIFQEFGKANIC